MVSKKLLSAAIAAAFISTPAFAAIELGDADTAIKYAKESLLSTAKVGSFYKVTDATTVLDVETELGFGVAADNQIWVRFDLTNAVFSTAVTSADLDGLGASAITVAQGGASESTSVVFAVTVDVDYAQADTVTLALADLGISATGAVGVTYSLYESASGAAAGGATGRLASTTLANAITTGNALAATFNAENAVAEVETAFLEFTTANGPLTANLGTVDVAVDSDFLAPDSTAVTLADVIDAADTTVTPAGNFTFGLDGGATFYFDADAACDSQDFAVLDADDEVVAQALSDVNGAALCVTVTGDEADAYAIPVASYTAAIDYEAVANAAFAATSAAGSFGSISRNGTVVQVPYLTTYEAYNQRLVLVNRGATAAAYSIAFTEEAGVTAAGKAAATGTLAPMETKIIKATDLVTITGSTRTAATVTIVAPTGDIDAATTTVNLADQATDTVVLQ